MTTTTPAAVRTLRPTRAALPVVAAGITMVLWASAFTGIRSAGAHYPPGAMALGRLTVGALALSAAVAHRRLGRRGGDRVRLPRGRPLAFVVGYGVLWFGVYAVAINAAEQHLDAGTTALLVNLAPLLVAVLAGLLLHEGFPRALAAGLVVAFAGVAVIAAATSTGRSDRVGVLLALAAAALYAASVLLQKQALRDVDPLTATWLGCLVGAATVLPFAPQLLTTVTTAPVAATLAVGYLGLFPTALAFWLWAYALARTSAGRLSASSYLVPALAVLLSFLLLGEVPAPAALLGGVLCLAGVLVTRLPRRGRGTGGRRAA